MRTDWIFIGVHVPLFDFSCQSEARIKENILHIGEREEMTWNAWVDIVLRQYHCIQASMATYLCNMLIMCGIHYIAGCCTRRS